MNKFGRPQPPIDRVVSTSTGESTPVTLVHRDGTEEIISLPADGSPVFIPVGSKAYFTSGDISGMSYSFSATGVADEWC